VTILDGEGKVIAETDPEAAALGSHLERPEIQEARIRGRGSATRYSRTMKEEMIYVALPIQKGPTSSATSAWPAAQRCEEDDRGIYGDPAAILPDHPRFVGGRCISLFPEAHHADPGHGAFHGAAAQGGNAGHAHDPLLDEIGQLAENINYMVDELQKRIAALQEEKAKVEAAFSSALDGS